MMEKNKSFASLPSFSETCSILNPSIKDLNNSKMLKKKREKGLISLEITDKILKKEKANDVSKKMLVKKKNINRSKSPDDYDEDLQEMKNKFENISLLQKKITKTPQKTKIITKTPIKTTLNKTPLKNYYRDNIPSPVRFNLPSSYIRNHFKYFIY